MEQTQTLQAGLGLIPLFPLLGSALAFLVGKRRKGGDGRNLSGPIATAASVCSFLSVLYFLSKLHEGVQLEHVMFQWFATGNLNVDFTLRLDHLSAVMCLVVTGIGSLIHLYSVAYMAEDEGRHRFFSYLNLFMFSMLLLVLGGNLLVLFVGWEGVGLCSYLLIGFWFNNLSYAAAGMKAFVVNRIGDAGFLLGIFLLWLQFGTVDFYQLSTVVGPRPDLVAFYAVAAFCLFIGATGKSAQIPLFVWLPDAMAGPTPVSALIHAATMVTAGVYMMARLHFLFVLAPAAMAIACWIAILTAFVAATTAVAQNDIKKVLAYSTVSQLGFMFMAATVGAFWVAVFHLVTHAFFKACLFLGAGSVIHGCHHEQDMRHMGGLRKYMPITCITYGLSTLAIAGLYPFAGYQSKHAILEALGHNANPYLIASADLLVVVASITAFITAFYMTRSFAMTFLGDYRGHAHPHESPWAMTLPLIVLAALATVGGLWLEGSLPHYLSATIPAEAHAAHHGLGEAVVAGITHSWVGILGVLLGLALYTNVIPAASKLPAKFYSAMPPLSNLLSAKYYFDEIYEALVVRPLREASYLLWKVVDQGVIDGLVNGTAAFIDVNGRVAQVTQTGQVRHYALFIFVSTIVIIAFWLLR